VWELLLDVSVVDGPLPIVVYALAGGCFVYLLFRDRSAAWGFGVVVLLIVGAILGAGVLWIAVNLLGAFGGQVDDSAWWWVPAATAASLVALWNLWRTRWWRKLVAVVAIPLYALAAAVGINAAYGFNPTIGSVLHISTADEVDLPDLPDPGDGALPADPAEPLWQTWVPPDDLPERGATGEVAGGIPNTVSGFGARPAQLYLPPAALVEGAPRLPLVIMMMGQPGDPDVQFLAEALDRFAADHDGLAPIGLVIDQLGDPYADPLCLDSDRGNVETYVMQDVVPWARAELGVLQGPRFWTVAGYSNGGGCAAYFGAKYPEVFGNLGAISPTEYAGVENPEQTLDEVFDGDELAYRAVRPAEIMAAKAPYPDSVGVFTVGAADAGFSGGTARLADAATTAGIITTLVELDGVDHDVRALEGGLDALFEVLYPRLGLEEPEADAAAAPVTPADATTQPGGDG
jgi:poly(3-hydroxybutyrate) depolymerase